MEGRPISLYIASKRSPKRPNTSSLRRLTSRMGWPWGIRALTSIMATNCRCACFLPRMPRSTRSGSLIPDFFSVFQQSVSYLYSGARLAVAEEWVGSHSHELSTEEEEFFRSSLEAQKQRKARELEAAIRRVMGSDDGIHGAKPIVLQGHAGGVHALAINPDNYWLGQKFSGWERQPYFPGEPYRKTFAELPGPDDKASE
jgi:hypothetical protein